MGSNPRPIRGNSRSDFDRLDTTDLRSAEHKHDQNTLYTYEKNQFQIQKDKKEIHYI